MTLFQLTTEAEMKDKKALGSGPYRLWPKMSQPEGVTTDAEGNIYVVGEPNQFMVLRRATPL
ncbi:MAG: SdiA-regulated domain-containing protein [Methylophaga sp.]|uniref:SdiA-regulated domain-containing protein n=1 Tax=Methylophaga sp. TaxID=2024840 RepID=UPI00299DB2E4|nr:SdiA-regulated domain-containing protein [Methylophaga sp.]MDX1750751.1 SdiA-regulated domain-containing protein [Methylophaga sp.]